MIVINKTIELNITYDFSQHYKLEDLLFFDIETTGFSPYNTTLYIIGCIYFKDGNWNIIQWFADNNTSEQEMLQAFFSLMQGYKVLVHFNGEGFDMPYLLKKCQKFNLDYNFDKIISLDIYKNILPYKKILKTENLKQKTVEKFLNLNREDKCSGGELISVYSNFLKLKMIKNPDAAKLSDLLLLHNEDDLKGMLYVVQILYYSDLFQKDFAVTNSYLQDDQLIITIMLQFSLPKRISYGKSQVYFSAFDKTATIKINLYKNELKFFYDNYKDYYYLPKEDTAIHKSIAFYVDKDFRTKAKAANCYSKKTSCFVPQFAEIVVPYFKIDYYDKITYFEATEEVIQDYALMKTYVKHLLRYLLKK